MYTTAQAYFEEADPEAFALMFDTDLAEDIEWLTAQSIERGVVCIKPDDGSAPLFALQLLHERFS